MIKKLSQVLEEFEHHKINEGLNEENEEGIEEITKKFRDFLFNTIKGQFPENAISPEVESEREYEVSSNEFSDKNKIIGIIVKFLNKHGITNKFVQKAILATIAKESGFTATREKPYTKTSPERIREIFGSRFRGLSNKEIEDLKKDENKFWERVYGGEWGRKNLGNTNPGDGAKFIGRGFNALTGRKNYQTYTNMLRKAGVNADLIQNPELLEKNPEIAAEVNALYFLRLLSNPTIKKKYGNSDPNDFKKFDTALKAVVNANAGPGTDINTGFAKQSYNAAVKKLSSMEPSFDLAISKSETNKTA